MDPDRIVEFLAMQYHEKCFSLFNFVDDNFMSTQNFLEGLFDDLAQADLIRKIAISFQTRAIDIVRFRDLLPKIQPMIFSIQLGIESFADSQLLRYEKNTTRAQNLESMEILRDLHIPFEDYYMFLDGQTSIEELRTNVQTILELDPVPYQRLISYIPERIVNSEYSVCCDLTGASSIQKIPFLEGFEFFLEETDGIRQGNVLYRSLKKIKEDLDTGQMQVGEETRSLLLGLEESLCPIIEQLSADRLSLALSLSEQVFQNKMPLKKAQSKLFVLKFGNLISN